MSLLVNLTLTGSILEPPIFCKFRYFFLYFPYNFLKSLLSPGLTFLKFIYITIYKIYL